MESPAGKSADKDTVLTNFLHSEFWLYRGARVMGNAGCIVTNEVRSLSIYSGASAGIGQAFLE